MRVSQGDWVEYDGVEGQVTEVVGRSAKLDNGIEAPLSECEVIE